MLIAYVPRRPALLRAMNVRRYGRAAISLRALYSALPFLTRYDIVHCQYGTNGEAVGALLKELGLQRRLVTTFHGYDTRLAEREGIRPFRRLLGQGDCFIAVSGYNHRQMLALGIDPAKLVLHPVGIDCRLFAFVSRTPKDAKREGVNIATVARLVPQKGLHFGISAVSRLLQAQPDLRLRYDILGGGPLHDDLTALIGQLGLRGIVHLHGPQRQDAVIDALRRSDIFLLPSTAEALPVALMEAQALGLPAVASAVGSSSDIVLDGKSGFLTPPGDVDALTVKLRFLIEQPQLQLSLGQAGSRHVRMHFDIDVLNDRLVQIYRKVLDSSPPNAVGAA